MDITSFLMDKIKKIDISDFMFNYYLKEFEPGWTMGKVHFHNAVEIICCLEGSGFYCFENDLVKVSKRDILLIKQGVKHLLYIENKGGKFVDIQLSTKHQLQDIFANDIFNRHGYIRITDNITISDTMKRIAIEMDCKKDQYEILVKSELIGLLIRINRIIEEERIFQSNKYIQQALEYIYKSLRNNITPKVIADSIHISPGYLMHLFKKHTNNTIMNYISEVRLEKSKELLINTNLKITDISNELGYYSVQHYSMDFKKSIGLTPTEFRKTRQCLESLNMG